jgi:hypothetical protein
MTPYLKPREAAQYLRRSVSWLAARRCRGDGPPYRKAGGHVLYTRIDLDNWLNGRVLHSTRDDADLHGSEVCPAPSLNSPDEPGHATTRASRGVHIHPGRL